MSQKYIGKTSLQFFIVTLFALFFPIPSFAITTVESISPYMGDIGNAASIFLTQSSDGRYVVFKSSADNLVQNDINQTRDIFVRDTVVGSTILVTRKTNGEQRNNEEYTTATVSDDGRYVGFIADVDIDTSDTNGGRDVYLRDLQLETTTLVSIGKNQTTPSGEVDPNKLRMSNDGRYVFFMSYANNLVLNDTNNTVDYFRKDMVLGDVERVNVGSDGDEDARFISPLSITPDGKFALFTSSQDNLTSNDINGSEDIFLRNLDQGTTEMIDVATNGNVANPNNKRTIDMNTVQISDDGRYVVFNSDTNELDPNDTNGTRDVYLRDVVNSTTQRVSVDNNGGETTNASMLPKNGGRAITSDGRYVFFESSGLTPDDIDGKNDIYKRDIVSQETSLVSLNTNGIQMPGATNLISISSSGDIVVLSREPDTVDGIDNNNGFNDFFVNDLHHNEIFKINNGLLGSDFFVDDKEVNLTKDGNKVLINSSSDAIISIDNNSTSDIYAKDIPGGFLYPVSVSDGIAASLPKFSNIISVTPDGRYIVFGSNVNNVIPNVNKGEYNLFWKDTQTGKTKGINIASGGKNDNEFIGGDYIPRGHVVISNDGRYVYFDSYDPYVVDDVKGSYDVYVRDMFLDKISIVSSDSLGNPSNNDSTLTSSSPHRFISSDGRYVLFSSVANNLTPESDWNISLYVKDILSGTIVHVNNDSLGTPQNGGIYPYYEISADGKYVFFLSDSDQLTQNDTNGSMDLFRKNIVSGDIERVNLDSSGNETVGLDTFFTTTPDGRYVLFSSYADNLVSGDVNGSRDLFLKDMNTGIVSLVTASFDNSNNGFGDGDFNSDDNALLSADGRYVYFENRGTNLVSNVKDGYKNIFMRDMLSGITSLISKDYMGNAIMSNSNLVSLSLDGHKVVFSNSSNSVVPNDINNIDDIYVYDLPTQKIFVASIDSYGVPIGYDGIDKTHNLGVSLVSGDVLYFSTRTDIFNYPIGNNVKGLKSTYKNYLSPKPTINSHTDGQYVINNSINILGGGVPFSTITLDVGGNISTGITDEYGNWTIPLNGLPEGNIKIDATQLSPGAMTGSKNVSVSIIVDTLYPNKPTIILPQNNQSIRQSLLYVGGTGEALARIDSKVNSTMLSTRADWQGNWFAGPYLTLPNGSYYAQARQTDQAGNIGLWSDMVPFTIQRSPNKITRISTSSTGLQANNAVDSNATRITSDGRYVVFSTYANNLTTQSTNGQLNIYLKDIVTNNLTKITSSYTGGQVNGYSALRNISPDGKYVTFESFASNIVSGDTNGSRDSFVKDMTNGNVSRISLGVSGQQLNGQSQIRNNGLSLDGKYAVFYTNATNAISGDTNGQSDAFIRDIVHSTTKLVTASYTGGISNYGGDPRGITSDGRYVVFDSYSSNIVPGDTNNTRDLFVRDTQNDTTKLLNASYTGGIANNISFIYDVSPDGRYVVFGSYANNLVSGDTNNLIDIFFVDILSGGVQRINTTSSGGQMNDGYVSSTFLSQDGKTVLFLSTSSSFGASGGRANLYMKNVETGKLDIVAPNTNANSIGNYYYATISSDGRFITFLSDVSDLVPGDTNGVSDIFVKDVQLNTIKRISVSDMGEEAISSQFNVSVTPDGRYVMFGTYSPNLVSGDTNGTIDVFLVDTFATFIPGPPVITLPTQSSVISASGMLTVVGTSEPRSLITLTIAGNIYTGQATWSGDWSIGPVGPFSNSNSYIINATQTNFAGYVSPGVNVSFAVAKLSNNKSSGGGGGTSLMSSNTGSTSQIIPKKSKIKKIDLLKPSIPTVIVQGTQGESIIEITPTTPNIAIKEAIVHTTYVDVGDKIQIKTVKNDVLEKEKKCYTPQEVVDITLGKNTTNKDLMVYQALLKSYDLTMFNDTDSYLPQNGLKRNEAAKMFVNFAKHVLCREATNVYENQYNDIDNIDDSLKPYIIEAYEYGILKGSNNKFRPLDTISRTEFVAALMRMFTNQNMDIMNTKNRDKNYQDAFVYYGLENIVGKNDTINRYNMSKIMYKLYYNKTYVWTDKGYVLPYKIQ